MPKSKSGSPKKGSPEKGSKKDSPGKKGGKKDTKKSLPKWSAEDCVKAEETTFGRRRYEVPMDPSYKKVALHIVLIVKKIHIFEVFNDAPQMQQFCNSNKGSKSGSPKAKGKDSPKGKKSPSEPEKPPPPVYERPIIEGVVAVRRSLLLQNDDKLFVEVTGTWKYREYSKVTPFPPAVKVQHLCYRDYYYLFPQNFERVIEPDEYNQKVVLKIRNEYGYEWEGYPFFFDLNGAPDSLTFNRPYNFEDLECGLFWNLRCFIGKYEFSKVTPDKECRMSFYKYTIAPSLLTVQLRKSQPFQYIRYKTLDDIGDLYLSASLNRDLFYHGEEIQVTINIENNSQRHVIESITVFFEQNYRFFHEIPHDNSIPLGEVWMKPGDGSGLPINPKSKSFVKTVPIKPILDWSKYNLVLDGKMDRDEKVFMASSTIIMKKVLLTPEEIAEQEGGGDSKGSPKKKDSPNKKDSPGSKKGSPKKEKSSPKDKKGKGSEADAAKEKAAGEEAGEKKPEEPPSKTILTNREVCHSVFVSYDIVVRCNLRTPSDHEAGHPQVRVPFILTRETRFINEWTKPPTYEYPPIKCNTVHTMKSQAHAFCLKYVDPQTVAANAKEASSKKGSPKEKSKSSPKSKKK